MDSFRTWVLRAAGRIERQQANRLDWPGHHRSPSAEPRTPRSERPRCGALTRKGKPCRAAVWDDDHDRPVNGRCRFHGGASSGPHTDAGREAIRESNRRRGVLRDLAELLPDLEAADREHQAGVILELTRDYPDHAGGMDPQRAAKAAGVSLQDLDGWRADPGFREAERRAAARWWRWTWQKPRRQEREAEARAEQPLSVLPGGEPVSDSAPGMYNPPAADDIDYAAMLDGLELPNLDDLELPAFDDLDLDMFGPPVVDLEPLDLAKHQPPVSPCTSLNHCSHATGPLTSPAALPSHQSSVTSPRRP